MINSIIYDNETRQFGKNRNQTPAENTSGKGNAVDTTANEVKKVYDPKTYTALKDKSGKVIISKDRRAEIQKIANARHAERDSTKLTEDQRNTQIQNTMDQSNNMLSPGMNNMKNNINQNAGFYAKHRMAVNAAGGAVLAGGLGYMAAKKKAEDEAIARGYRPGTPEYQNYVNSKARGGAMAGAALGGAAGYGLTARSNYKNSLDQAKKLGIDLNKQDKNQILKNSLTGGSVNSTVNNAQYMILAANRNLVSDNLGKNATQADAIRNRWNARYGLRSTLIDGGLNDIDRNGVIGNSFDYLKYHPEQQNQQNQQNQNQQTQPVNQ